MSTNTATAPDPVEKRQSLQTINNFLLRLIYHFKIETCKPNTKVVHGCGGIIEGFPVVAKDWVTVQVSHNCLSKTFVEFVQSKLNPVLISKGYSHLNAVILHEGEMSFCVEFAAKAITPHSLPIAGNEALFDLFAKNWNEVYQKHFTKRKAVIDPEALEIAMREQKAEVKAILKTKSIKKKMSDAIATLNLKLATAAKASGFGASFMVTASSKKDAVMAGIDEVSETFKKLFGEKGVSISFSYPGQDKNLPHIGYWIKVEYQTLKDFAEKQGVLAIASKSSTATSVTAPKKTKKAQKASSVQVNKKARQKRKEEMASLIPIVREKVTPLLKESLKLSIHTLVSSGASVLVTTQISRKNSDPGKDEVVKIMESSFGVGCVIVSELKSKGAHAGYSILFPYEKAIKIFTGTAPIQPIVQKTDPVKTELSVWAAGIIAGALTHATDAELMSEMSDRGDSDLKILEKFISGFSNEALITELGKRVADMKPEEKLKLIQLFSK